MLLVPIVAALAVGASAKPQLDPQTHQRLLHQGRPQVALWQALLREQHDADHSAQASFRPTSPLARSHCFPQKISHFDESINGTFCQRYWLDASHYKPGGPVYLLDGGETSGENRIPFLETGILEILGNATDGLSIVLEHRYYGDSVPVESFSTDDLRFLNNAEALEDSAYFIENFKPPSSLDLDEYSFHPNNTPWIYYGGSYAGARAAHMRVQYPDLVWGAIASSGVTHAQVVFSEYYDPIQQYAPPECISTLQSAVAFIDTILDHPKVLKDALKGLFGLGVLGDGDFADVISSPLGYWQARNWDDEVGSMEFYKFCDALTVGGAGSKIGLISVPASVLNYAKYIKETVVAECPSDDVDDCFGSDDVEKFRYTDLSQTWRLWIFQVCTQWGYFMPAPPAAFLSIVSRHLTLGHTQQICPDAFPPGKFFSIPDVPDVEEVNKRGDYGIEADRLAFIDGDSDPWRVVTPQSDFAEGKKSSVNRPRHIIFDGVHHYDENGLADHSKEPARVRDVHEFEKLFVSEWLAQWKEEKLGRGKDLV
ncbi:hypothetical protein L202_06253 [Cryptococcus amylolentus CBS 6039]|uniref:Serine carboxypeptidase S28 n=1 Tax=Cryptococcus amylolentus CBS 6039 TaxID=1295533 RepID=A0A1E3HFB6_9TREE|nr:hypothetical protein L202_06253 [Cryptococcus amylolentus CBS 6039]ODN75032.1 hypothetical protein L202_06253 [Cryptococcus amylolentus CBS 6039]